MKGMFFILLLVSSVAFSQSAKKLNVVLKEQLVTAKAQYDSDVAIYLSDFKLLEKERQDYRSYSKHEFKSKEASLKQQIAELRRLMDFCEAFNIDYTKLVNEGNLKSAESSNFKINTEEERAMLSEILVFQNVKDTLVLDELKPKVQNVLLKNQLDIYAAAKNQNAAVLLKQQQLAARIKNASNELDSISVTYYRSIIELDQSLSKLRAYTNQLYENQCRDNKGGTAFTFRYETEFKPKPSPTAEPMTKTYKSPFVTEIVDVPAEFPGGAEAYTKYIDDQIQLPTAITELGVEGKCYVQFIVKTTGEISDVVVVKGIVECPDCSREASRLVKEMPKWIPGKTAGKEVDSRTVIPISFKVK